MPLPKVNFGKINLNVNSRSRRFKTKDGTVLRVNKVEGKTSFFSRFRNMSKVKKGDLASREVLHLSKEARILSKKYPEFSSSVEKWLQSLEIDSLFNFKNRNVEATSKIFYPEHGLNHHLIFKLDVNFLKENKKKEYFVKYTYSRRITAPPEFIANKVFEKFGIETIKPHIAYFQPPVKNVIIYDFTNLEILANAKKKGIITDVEKNLINMKLMSLRDYSEKLGLRTPFKHGIVDFLVESNIFVKKENGNLKIYFTDLMFSRNLEY